MFGRKRNRAADEMGEEQLAGADLDELLPEDAVEGQQAPEGLVVRGNPFGSSGSSAAGPWDVVDLHNDGIGRVDLGSLLMPVLDGAELRIDVDQATGALLSATLATPTSVMQVLAFAAPKSSGIWAEVRSEIVESIRGGGGKADVVDGVYGLEIVADVPSDVPGSATPSRFIGVDGPRWFLRALVQGEAAVTPSVEPVLQRAFGLIAVVRGSEAMAVRDSLPLRLPKDLLPPSEAGPSDSPDEPAVPEPESPLYILPERGPLNTETR